MPNLQMPGGNDVQATANSPFLSALGNLFGSGPSPFAALGNQDLGGQNALGLLSKMYPAPSGGNVPSIAPQQPQSINAATAGQGGGSSLQDILGQIFGQAPGAPTAADFGPAPTLSQFFSAAPYQQALASLAAGTKQGQGTINGDYTSAQGALNKIIGQANSESRGQMQGAAQAAASAWGQENNALNQASALAGPGGGAQAQLAGLQGTLFGQQQAQGNLDRNLASIQSNNLAQDNAALSTDKMNALNALAAASAGEGNKINLAEMADQAKAQQELNAANNARGVAMGKADQSWQSAMNARQTGIDKLLSMAETSAGRSAGSNKSNALDTLSGWLQGDAASQGMGQAAQSAIFGGKNSSGQSIPAAHTAGEALQRLAQFGLPQATAQQISQVINQYFQGGGATPDILGALEAMFGGGGSSGGTGA